MIQLHPDYLLLETSAGKIIPCSAELVAVELIGEGSEDFDPHLVQQAAAAVLHYFRQDLGCSTVSVGEFSKALEQALLSLGSKGEDFAPKPEVGTFDLQLLADKQEGGLQLSFFPQLRDALRSRLAKSPKVLRFFGLRGCVKQLIGAKRWDRRCQALQDQIVAYLRACLETDSPVPYCELVIL
jgi:hypothetical protein